MKKNLLFISIFLFSFSLQAQNEEETRIKATITQLFDAMRKVDSASAKMLFYPDASLKTILTKKDGTTTMQKEKIEGFLKAIATPRKDLYDERVLSWDIRIDGALASAWCDYAFYLNDKFLHCGVDAFQLIKTAAGWRILDITDTRRKENCQPMTTTNEIDTVMNRWHRAAATADEDVFFGLMTANADYVGTDPMEHWKRDELRKWSEKFFARDSAWDFKAKSRTVYFTPNGQHAWFDELLDTWMGDCRGSGVLVKTDKGWRIEQYVLSMAVLNDLTKGYIDLLKQYKK
jgi:hypothetical protein